MRTHSPLLRVGRSLLLAALSACAAAEEPAPAGAGEDPTTGCSSDAACGAGLRCVAGACEGAPPDEACTFEADPVCGQGRLCVAVSDAFCPGDGVCEAPTRCVPVVGAAEGAFGCAVDEDCRSGLCWEGLCLRLCRDAADCEGGACLDVTISERVVRASFCLPVDAAGAIDPAHPRCESDRACADGQVCRRRSGDPYSPDSRAFCAELDPALAAPGEACAMGNRSVEGAADPRAIAADATCQHNTCENACLSIAGVCRRNRCTQPCTVSDECPARTTCQPFDGPHEDPVVPLRSCWLPFGACLDELDCCPERAPDGTCLEGWGLLPTHCAVLAQGGRLVTLCGSAPGTIAPGAPCEADADCGSGLCLGGVAGEADRCAFICDPDLDRCPALTGTPTSRCTREAIESGGVVGAIEVCR